MGVYESKNSTKDGRKYFFKCQYSISDDEKPKTKVSSKFKTQAEAARAEEEFLKKVELSKDCPVDMTFKELYNLFLEDRKTSVRYSTYQGYDSKHKYIKCFDKIKCIDFNISHYEMWKAQFIKKKKISLRYKNDILKFFKSIMNFGTFRYNFNFDSVYRKMDKFYDPHHRKKEMKFYTLDEFNKFINCEKDLRWKCFFSTLYFCGLRCGEARGLKWSDIDFNKNIISITKQAQPIPKNYEGPEEFLLLPPKTATSNRRIPMCNRLSNILQEYKNNLINNNQYNNNYFVFSSSFTRPMTEYEIVPRKKKICKLSGVKYIRTHDFRHSCASLLINNGANITVVAKYLGHSEVEETLNTYSHMFPDALDGVIKVVNNLSNKESH